jgi:hypothetical protein
MTKTKNEKSLSKISQFSGLTGPSSGTAALSNEVYHLISKIKVRLTRTLYETHNQLKTQKGYIAVTK